MSKMKLGSGVVLLGAAGAVAYLAMRAGIEGQARAEAAGQAAAAQAESDRLAGLQRTAEQTVSDAAGTKPLNAALDDHVDSATLVDLFDNEEWWHAYREVELARVIVGDALLATRGKVEIGQLDAPAVKNARRQRVSSSIVTVSGTRYVVAAARLSALPEKEPVLVFARPLPAAPPAAPVAVSAPKVTDRPLPWAGAGLLALGGLALAVAGLKRGAPAAGAMQGTGMVSAVIPKEPTLRFGTPMHPQRGVGPIPGSTAAMRQPMATGSAVSIPGMTAPSPVPAMVTGAGAAVVTSPAAPAVMPPVAAPAPHANGHAANGHANGAAANGAAAGAVYKSTPTPPPTSGSFGRYTLIDRLGEGGMSEIFTAEANGVEGFSRTFVLKRLRPELARDKEAVAQFIDEARMQASLVHSNIVPVFDFGTVKGEYFLTQEYIAGRDIVRLISRYQQETGNMGLEPRLAFYIAYETLQALGYAHSRRDKGGQPMGIVHRDVSAGNIIVSLQGEVKLSDFGIVKSNRRVTKTQVGMVKGNANFMSPEQARGMTVDHRSDLFSLAQVLYFCLTGELLYNGANDLDVLYKAATGPTYDDFQKMHQLPEPAGMILEKALAFDPRERFQSAEEFAGVLAAHVGGGKGDASGLMQALFGGDFKHEAA